MPTVSLVSAPPRLPAKLLRPYNAPLPLNDLNHPRHSFGAGLDARKFSTPGRSTSELLRTL